MNKEEIKHFKSLLRQGSLRHMNILLNDKFQKELQTIIEDYEKLQQENEKLKDNWNKLKEYTQEKYDNPSWASCGARYVLEKRQVKSNSIPTYYCRYRKIRITKNTEACKDFRRIK